MGAPPQQPAQTFFETAGRIQGSIAGGVGVAQSAGAARGRRQIQVGSLSRNAIPTTRRHPFDPGRHHGNDAASAALGDSPDDLHAHWNVADAFRRGDAPRQRGSQVHLERIVLAYFGDPHPHYAGQSGQQRPGGFLRGACLFEVDGHAPSYASFTLRARTTAEIGFAYVSPLPLDPPWSPPAKRSAAASIWSSTISEPLSPASLNDRVPVPSISIWLSKERTPISYSTVTPSSSNAVTRPWRTPVVRPTLCTTSPTCRSLARWPARVPMPFSLCTSAWTVAFSFAIAQSTKFVCPGARRTNRVSLATRSAVGLPPSSAPGCTMLPPLGYRFSSARTWLFERMYSALDDPDRTKHPSVPAMMNPLARKPVDEPMSSGRCLDRYHGLARARI